MKHFAIVFLITLVLFISAINVPASGVEPDNPTTTNSKSAEAIVAELSDEQARRLLIGQLKKEALAAELVSKSAEDNVGKLAGFVENIKNKVTLVQERIEFLRSGGKSDNQEMNGLFAFLRKGEADFMSIRSIFSVLVIFVVAYAIELLFHWYATAFRDRIVSDAPVVLRGKIGRLLLRLCIDVISTLTFIVAAMLCFYFFFERTHALLIMVAAYLSAIVTVRMALIISRFFLSPKDPSSRFLPIPNAIAQFLYRWIAAISIFTSFGLLTCGIIRLIGASEAVHVKAVSMVALLITGMLIVMILQKRKEIADTLSAKFPAESHPAKLMRKWHHFAIFFVLLFLILSMSNTLLGNFSGDLSIKTLLMIPFYFLMDWILCQILEILFGFIPKDKDTIGAVEAKDDAGNKGFAGPEMMIKQVGYSRMKEIIVLSLRIALAALFIIWTLNIWGIELSIGEAVAKAVFNILIVVLICYVLWEFLNTVIQRRLSAEMPGGDEDLEEGGAGGSRIGTLLLLLRKFLIVFILVIGVMIILSSMGINIGPMIAGAGVIGLAIGFGSQTLVRDILSGVFFLIDDAFRVGDYIETGGIKGMVQHISLRSVKLRHPRGMVFTIPFGDMGAVQNFSRDYIITKLDVRVRYDADIDKIRKIIKKIGKEFEQHEEIGPVLLSPIKSQGVREMDDSAMILRVKFKTPPGEQFVVRREVYKRIQERFREEGIEFAHRNVTVYLPPEAPQTAWGEEQDKGAETAGGAPDKKIIEAGAAAAIAAAQVDEDAKKPKGQ